MKKLVSILLVCALMVCLVACGDKEVKINVNEKKENNYFKLTITDLTYNAEKEIIKVNVLFENVSKVRLTMTYEDKDGFNCGIGAKSDKSWSGTIEAKARTNDGSTKTSFFVNIDPGNGNITEFASCDLIIKDGECTVNLNVNEKTAEKAILKYELENGL